MATEIIMPKAGMAMEFGTVIKWLKEEGDSIEKGEPILEIMTDKVNMEVEAEESGVLLKKTAAEGQELPVFTVIGFIGAEGEKVPDAAAAPSATEEKVQETAPVSSSAEYDVIVVGGGPAGYIAAIKAAQLAGKVAVVEKDTVGGTCLNRGCIPTKTLLKTSELMDHVNHAKSRGLIISDPTMSIDMPTVIKEKDKVVAKLTGGIGAILKSYGVDTISGVGSLTKDKTVKIDNGQELTGKKIILCGGSIVARVPIPGVDSKRVIDSTDILKIQEVPKRLAIIGGGVIGVEMASIFSSFGSEVTIIEMMDRIVPPMDPEISKELQKQLSRKKITIKTGIAVNSIEENSDSLTLSLGDDTKLDVDYALLSVGRTPDLSCLGELEFKMDRNKVVVNDKMETSISGIYAAGDINGRNMLAHAAYKMGEIAAANAMGHSEETNLKYVPGCIYTSPEVGAVGLTEEKARESHDVIIGRFNFGANGRSLASGEGNGFVKVIADKKYHEILGVHIIGPNAAEMINEAAVLMATEITVSEAAGIIHGHPTYSEALMEAFNDALGICLHMPKK